MCYAKETVRRTALRHKVLKNIRRNHTIEANDETGCDSGTGETRNKPEAQQSRTKEPQYAYETVAQCVEKRVDSVHDNSADSSLASPHDSLQRTELIVTQI